MVAQILALIVQLEPGYMPLDTWRGYVPDSNLFVGVDLPLYANLGVEIEIAGLVFIGGSVRTEFSMKEFKVGSFSPHLMNYGFGVGIRPVEGIEIGFRHHCLHPIVPYMQDSGFHLTYEGAYEEIYILIKKKIPLL